MRLSLPIGISSLDQAPDHLRSVGEVRLAFPKFIDLLEKLVARDDLHALIRGNWLFHISTIPKICARIKLTMVTMFGMSLIWTHTLSLSAPPPRLLE